MISSQDAGHVFMKNRYKVRPSSNVVLSVVSNSIDQLSSTLARLWRDVDSNVKRFWRDVGFKRQGTVARELEGNTRGRREEMSRLARLIPRTRHSTRAVRYINVVQHVLSRLNMK